MSARRFAAIDVGTNTTLCLIVERRDDGSLVALDDRLEITRLGRGVDARGALSDDAMARTLAALERHAKAARALGASEVRGVGTSALRDAANATEFVARARAAGVELEVISGAREAALTYLGATVGIDAPGPRTVVDVGGGSTEIVRGEEDVMQAAVSLDVGSVRLFERHVRRDPPAPEELAAIARDVDRALDRAELATGGTLVALAGTATTVAAIARGVHPFDAEQLHGMTLSTEELEATLARLVGLTTDERRAVPGMEKGREDVIVAGATILACIVRRARPERLVISDGGVRWGLARELARAASTPAEGAC